MTAFVSMQLKRHRSDYYPYAKFYKSEVAARPGEVSPTLA